MQNQSTALTTAFIAEIKRRLFEESMFRLKKCLTELTEAQIWYRPNKSSNSVGNLVLHLHGNVRQWVQQEFDEQGPVPVAKMLADMEQLMIEVDAILDNTTSADLLEVRNVQGYQESGLSILVHITEHFSYHIGQMTYIVKMLKDKDMGYYEGHDLEAK